MQTNSLESYVTKVMLYSLAELTYSVHMMNITTIDQLIADAITYARKRRQMRRLTVNGILVSVNPFGIVRFTAEYCNYEYDFNLDNTASVILASF